MQRRHFLSLAIGGGIWALSRGGLGRAVAQSTVSVPTVDRLVMTNVVDNLYDVFAKAGRLDTITVQRTPLSVGRRSSPSTASPTTWSRCAARSVARSCSTSASPS